MAKVKIFSFIKNVDTSMIASARIARFISAELGVPVTTDEQVAEHPLDLLIIVNGAYAFCKYLEPLGKAISEANRVAWVQNDYTIIPPKDDGDAASPFRRAFVFRKEQGCAPTMFWSTCEKWAKLPGSTYVNWNCLTFDAEAADEGNIKRRRKSASDDLFYYGSFRHGSGRMSRKIYFDRYFNDPKVQVVISSPDKKFAEYQHRSPGKVTLIGKMEQDFYDAIGSHGAGLYIEDRKSHDEFHSPANRFYEMLSAGLPIIFQPECGTMLRKAGYDPTPWMAGNKLEVERAMEKREKWGREQREAFGSRVHEERIELPKTLKKLYRAAVKS